MSNLYKSMIEIQKENLISFHMPGHKNNMTFYKKYFNKIGFYALDTTEIPGTDHLHNPKTCIQESQNKLSKYYQSKKSYFLVNGSTCGILAMIHGLIDPDKKLLMNRHVHQSVLHSLQLKNITPVYLIPRIDNEYGLILDLDLKVLDDLLTKDKDIQGVFLTYPSYEGVCFDLNKVAAIVKKHNRYLLIDEAHGSHLRIHKNLPMSATETQADVIVQSAHKNLPAVTQGAFLHVNNTRIIASIDKYLRIFQSSSPSYIIMNSLDISVDFMIKSGYEAMSALLKWIKDLHEYIYSSAFVLVNDYKRFKNESILFDPTKIVISSLSIGLSGNQLEKLLREEYHIQVEYSTHNYIVLIATMMNRESDFITLKKALKDIQQEVKKPVKLKAKESLLLNEVIVAMNPYEVETYEKEVIAIDSAVNKVAYESVIPYPPGIPLINPGEKITTKAISKIKLLQDNIQVIKEIK